MGDTVVHSVFNAQKYSQELHDRTSWLESRLSWEASFPERLWLATSAYYFLQVCKFRVGRIRREMEQGYSLAVNQIDTHSADQEFTLNQAQQFADMANKIFQLAEKSQLLCAKIESPNSVDFWEFRIIRWCLKEISILLEETGCFSEDAGETLALSASEPFAALVQRELEELAAIRL